MKGAYKVRKKRKNKKSPTVFKIKFWKFIAVYTGQLNWKSEYYNLSNTPPSGNYPIQKENQELGQEQGHKSDLQSPCLP